MISKERSPGCGGAILSSLTILTAAHCTWEIDIKDIKVVVGEHDVTKDDGQERFTVCKKLEHPNYNE